MTQLNFTFGGMKFALLVSQGSELTPGIIQIGLCISGLHCVTHAATEFSLFSNRHVRRVGSMLDTLSLTSAGLGLNH